MWIWAIPASVAKRTVAEAVVGEGGALGGGAVDVMFDGLSSVVCGEWKRG